MSKTWVIRTKNNETYMFEAPSEEFGWLLETFVLPANPELVMGYSEEAEERFYALYPEIKKSDKENTRKHIGCLGIPLVALGVIFLVSSITSSQTALTVPYIMSAIFSIGGLVLMYFGFRKKHE